jgi:hypothetical protein
MGQREEAFDFFNKDWPESALNDQQISEYSSIKGHIIITTILSVTHSLRFFGISLIIIQSSPNVAQFWQAVHSFI